MSEHQIQPEYGDEQADAGRDCRTRLAPSRKTKLSGANADREIFIFPVQLTTSRIDNLIRLIHTLAIYVTIHTLMSSRMSPRKIGQTKRHTAHGNVATGARERPNKYRAPPPKSYYSNSMSPCPFSLEVERSSRALANLSHYCFCCCGPHRIRSLSGREAVFGYALLFTGDVAGSSCGILFKA